MQYTSVFRISPLSAVPVAGCDLTSLCSVPVLRSMQFLQTQGHCTSYFNHPLIQTVHVKHSPHTLHDLNGINECTHFKPPLQSYHTTSLMPPEPAFSLTLNCDEALWLHLSSCHGVHNNHDHHHQLAIHAKWNMFNEHND